MKKLFPTQPLHPEQGFTLTEVLVVVVIAGVLAAIAAPSWLAFMNRQRVGEARTELLQYLREAQSSAIAKRTSYGIEIDANAQSIKRFSAKGARPNGTGAVDAAKIGYISEQKLGNEDGTELTLSASDSAGTDLERIVFNFDGSIALDTLGNNIQVPLYVSVQLPDQPNSRRCVVIETILGAMREESGNGANTCPY